MASIAFPDRYARMILRSSGLNAHSFNSFVFIIFPAFKGFHAVLEHSMKRHMPLTVIVGRMWRWNLSEDGETKIFMSRRLAKIKEARK